MIAAAPPSARTRGGQQPSAEEVQSKKDMEAEELASFSLEISAWPMKSEAQRSSFAFSSEATAAIRQARRSLEKDISITLRQRKQTQRDSTQCARSSLEPA